MNRAMTTVILIIISLAASAQPRDRMAGTWTLNLAKSHYSPDDPPQSQTTIFEAIPKGMKAVSTTVRADGTMTRIDTTFLFDGKEYEVQGAAVKTLRSYTRPSERRLEWIAREDGKITTTTICELSVDGNTRTVTTTGHDLKGRLVNNLAVYDRTR